jgi:hypothetical protein
MNITRELLQWAYDHTGILSRGHPMHKQMKALLDAPPVRPTIPVTGGRLDSAAPAQATGVSVPTSKPKK